MSDLSEFVKAYDVRGTVPDQLNERVAEALGAAFAQLLLSEAQHPTPRGARRRRRRSRRYRVRHAGVARPAWPRRSAPACGPTGLDVIDAGLGSTDLLYYASGALDLPGAMFTASHNPARYNGIKLCRAGARPIGQDTGLREIRDRAQAILDGRAEPVPGRRRGAVQRRDLLADYAAYLRGPGRSDRDPAAAGWWSTPATAWPATPCRRCSATRCCRRCR